MFHGKPRDTATLNELLQLLYIVLFLTRTIRRQTYPEYPSAEHCTFSAPTQLLVGKITKICFIRNAKMFQLKFKHMSYS